METQDTLPHGTGPQPAAAGMPSIPGYEVLALVGRGGMGRVYRARHIALGRIVALKLLVHEPDEKSLARFREEARAVARLQHPNIAQLFETGVADGNPYYAQEFVEGGSLAQVYASEPQEPFAVAQLVETIARAIQHSHDNGILHRDLKPGNILVARDGTPKVTDFGLAKSIDHADPADTTVNRGAGLTRTGEIVGTPGYMPPEQASGVVANLGPATDVYALGAILYEALTGRPPFQSPEPLQTVLMVLSMDPVSPRTLQPRVPRDLETICLKCLEKSPKRRYASAKDLADDLRRFQVREPIVARPVGRIERMVKWARRKPWQAVAVALGLVVAVGLVIGLVWVTKKNQQVREANDNLAANNEELERANKAAISAREEAERTLALTLHTLETYFFDFSDRLRDLPKGEKLRREVLDNARATLDRLHKFSPNNAAIQERRMIGYDRLGNAESTMGNVVAAEADYTRSRDIAVELEAHHPGNPMFRRGRLLAIAKLADLTRRRGEVVAGDALLESIRPEVAALGAELPDEVNVLELRILVGTQVANIELRHQRPDAAGDQLRELCSLNRNLARVDRDNPARTLRVVDADTRLALFLLDTGKLHEAGPILERTMPILERLPDPDSPAVRRLRAFVMGTAGSYHLRLNQYRKATEAYTAALKEYESLVADFPNSPLYRHYVADTLYYLATSTILSGVLVFGNDVTGSVVMGMKHLRRCEQLFAALADQHPTDTTYRERHAAIAALLKKLTPKDKKP